MSPDLPPPGPDTVLARMAARRDAIAALGGGVELYAWRTERLVEVATALSSTGGER